MSACRGCGETAATITSTVCQGGLAHDFSYDEIALAYVGGYMTRQESDDAGLTTDRPTHVRVYSQDDGWAIQGEDDQGIPTWAVWWFEDHSDAINQIEAFIEDATCYGLSWSWRTNNTQEATA